MRQISYYFQHVLAIAILFVRPSLCLSHGWISISSDFLLSISGATY